MTLPFPEPTARIESRTEVLLGQFDIVSELAGGRAGE